MNTFPRERESPMEDQSLMPAFILAIIVIFLLILTWAVPVRLWIEAIFAGVRIGLGDLVGMRLRKVSPAAVVRPMIAATKAGLDLSTRCSRPTTSPAATSTVWSRR
jgi:uncharacterized protein YqfA (UPF0365 family)